MIGKVIGTLILGGGLGIPISATLRTTIVSERIPRILETSDSIVKLEWDKEKSHEKVSELIDELGRMINEGDSAEKKEEKKEKLISLKKRAKVLAVRISTKGAFDDNICRQLGFDPGLKEPPLNPKGEVKAEDIKGIGCYTNLDI